MKWKDEGATIGRRRVSALYVYPVKSLGGIAVSRAMAQERGFRHDRRWMLVDDRGGFLTQRTQPEMALVKTALHNDQIVLSTDAGQHGQTELPLAIDGADSIEVKVWSDTVPAMWPQLDADRWMSEVLGVTCRFVYMPEHTVRRSDRRYAPEGVAVSFADSFPYLLATVASLDDLKSRADAELDMRRFRPNVVVSGTGAYEEDQWRDIRVGAVAFRLVKPCARCVVTTLDPDTAVRGKEPLRTLASYRNKDGKTLFGYNMVAEVQGVVAVGDPVEVLKWAK